MTDVSREETVTRYFFDREYVRKDGALHWRALMPDRSGKTSVFRVSQLSEDEIWRIGSEKVAAIRQKSLVGRADLIAASVYDKTLRFAPDNDPESRHADIIGWPEDKDKKHDIALDLADGAEVKVK